MSRWTCPKLPSLTEQQIFEQAAYHMLAHGGAPGEVFMKPGAEYHGRPRSWGYLVKHRRAPKHAVALLSALDRVHREDPPDTWARSIVTIAHTHNLKVPQ